MAMEAFYTIDFGDPGSGGSSIPANWDAPESGRRWARGPRSALRIPCPAQPVDSVLLLTIDPYLARPVLVAQTLRVLIDGKLLRLVRFQDRTILACPIDAAVFGGRSEIELVFEHPCVMPRNELSASPDAGGYAVAFVNLTLARQSPTPQATVSPSRLEDFVPTPVDRLSDRDLMGRFVSIGDNCEFGFSQRHNGAEPMDLLRFAGIREDGLLRALKSNFAGLDAFDEFTFRVAGVAREYIFTHPRYQMSLHTLLTEGTLGVAQLFHRQLSKLRLQRRLFLTDLAEARRIFLYKQNHPTAVAEIMPFFRQLRRQGQNTLLYVVLADARHPPGTVDVVENGLLRGYIDHFSPYTNADRTPTEFWPKICRNAYAIWCDQYSKRASNGHDG